MKKMNMAVSAGAVLAASALTASLVAPAANAATVTQLPSAHAGAASHRTAPLHAIPFTAAEVTDHGDGTYTITWDAPGVSHVRIFTGAQQNRIDTRDAVAQGGSTGSVTLTDTTPADRRWFRLVPDRGDALTLADRLVRLDGTVNFRDLGGYRTTSGQWVAMGKVYRSGALDKLSAADLAELQRLDIRTDVDLRTEGERTAAPDRVPAGTKYVVADVLGGSISSFSPTTPDAAEQEMVDAEKTMVSSATGEAAYTTLFQDVEHRPGALVFHCSAGKDRAGWGAAALLTTLGVPSSTVESDYLLSNDYRAAANAAALAQLPAAQAAIYKPLLDVRPEYLRSGFDDVQSTFGSWNAYLRQGLDQNVFDRLALDVRLLES